MTTRSAFAPGHVSGLFAVHDEHADPLRKGSRGAGWSLNLGALATVRDDAPATRLNSWPVTQRALELLDPRALRLNVQLDLQLPVGQGFGMSAAGSLAACLAAGDLLGLEPEQALAAAHRAEVEAGTGLGDAIGAWVGGAEVRIAPGIPPHGGAIHVDSDAAFLFCVMGAGIPTPKIIRDDAWKRRTRELGDVAVDRILAAKRGGAWQSVLAESHAFSLALGLMPPAMRKLGQALPSHLQWGQAMLGSTMWVTGDAALLAACRDQLHAAGAVIAASVDASGARLVRAPSPAASQ